MQTDIETLYRQTLDFISDLKTSKSSLQVFTLFQEYVRGFGATSLAVGQNVNPIVKGKPIKKFGWHDWPDEWAHKYSENNYVLHDPVAKFSMKARQSFEWSKVREKADIAGRKIMEEGGEFSFTNGITIPVQAGNYPTGLISLGFPDELPSLNILASLELAAIHCYTKLLSFFDLDENAETPALTKREIDVLSFVAIGKSNWEISRVLGIAESSAIQHMKNISRKLHAANRTHAVTIAVQSGQIRL